MARSLIPNTAWARRLIYELIYLSFGFNRTGMFNVGFAPAQPDIHANPDFADRPNQIQLYAEMFDRLPWEADRWRRSECLELAAGCGGGLLYLNTHRVPRTSIGVEQSNVAVWRARRLGVDVRQGDVARLAFEDERFDCVFCVDALGYFPVAAALKEAFRVARPGGYLLLAESFHGSRDAAQDHFRRIGEAAGFDFLDCHDATDGVRRSLLEAGKRSAFVLRLPPPPPGQPQGNTVPGRKRKIPPLAERCFQLRHRHLQARSPEPLTLAERGKRRVPPVSKRERGRDVHWAGALGRDGQSIRIVPELDLVVVVTAGYYQDYSPRAFQVQSGIFRDVLQAISPPG